MTSYSPPIEDMSFLLNTLFDMESIAKLPGYEEASPDLVGAVLEEAGKFFGEVVAPTNQLADQQGSTLEGTAVKTAPALDGVYDQLIAAGWPGLASDPEYGGQGLPLLLSVAVDEMAQAANMSFGLCPMLTKGVTAALKHYGSDALKSTYLPKLVSGEWAGTMNLTEPQAGSDLAAITTKAEPEGEHYRLRGSKIFITWGEHSYTENIVHLVLARTPDAPAGVKGISLFVVPKFLLNTGGSLGERNDVYCVGLEHKLGIHASPTCTLNFGDNEGAIGYLVGEENRGLMYMFAMMNEARMAVGLQGVAISDRAYQHALTYAKERIQGSTPEQPRAAIIHHPDVQRMLLTMRALTEGGRAMAYWSQYHLDFAIKSDTDTASYHQRRVDMLTPLSKSWCTEASVEVTSLGVQVHGGMGFVEETGAAQYYRDARILPIYEGTNGIQALDLVGRKIQRDKGQGAGELLDALEKMLVDITAVNQGGAHKLNIDGIELALANCRQAVALLLAPPSDDWRYAGSIAHNVLMLFGTTVAAVLLAKSAAMAVRQLNEGESSFLQQKVRTAQFFCDHILPRQLGYFASIQASATDCDHAPYLA